jgi:hypothetical protein
VIRDHLLQQQIRLAAILGEREQERIRLAAILGEREQERERKGIKHVQIFRNGSRFPGCIT